MYFSIIFNKFFNEMYFSIIFNKSFNEMYFSIIFNKSFKFYKRIYFCKIFFKSSVLLRPRLIYPICQKSYMYIYMTFKKIVLF